MKEYQTGQVRNIALIGHGSSGKTTISEAALYVTDVTKRQGRTDDGNTASDFDKEEISRKISIGTSVIPIELKDIKYNFLDTPGYFDFIGEMYGALRAADGAVIVIDASSGIEVGTEKAWQYTQKNKVPTIMFMNKMDKENINFEKLLSDIKDKFGEKVVPFGLPIYRSDDFKGVVDVIDKIAKEYNGREVKTVDIPSELQSEMNSINDDLIEKIAETDEALMEKYFDGESFTEEEIRKGLKIAVKNGDLVPLIPGSADKDISIDLLLNLIERYIPAPNEVGEYKGMSGEKEMSRKVDSKEPFSALVFKTIVDPFVGKLSVFKVISGKITKDKEIFNSNKDSAEKLGGLFALRGKTQLEVSEIDAGDIGATSKLQFTQTGDTLCDKSNPIQYEKIQYPEPCLFMAVEPKTKGDEEKIGSSLQRLTEEDPTFVLNRNKETKQLLIGGQGNMQLSVIVNKLKNTFGVDVNMADPKIAYRETIKGTSSVQGKHKKQSGGAGQYGDVHVRFEPTEEEFIFDEEVFGGAVPRQYIPAVEKGLRECLDKGVLAGYPVVNVKAVLFDGSYHPVDSNEMAFKIAASIAFKKGMEAANPVLLEPIMRVEILIPDAYMGDIMGDMNKRRGKILGMEQQEDGMQLVIAEAPQAELFKYAIDLRSMTQARGSFTMHFVRYEEVPANISQKIIEESKKD
ncbi:elongation factor G [Acidilutibacter cellobiosedens]|jgi:elongation factor G|uniref:Elongation factor G n=1 Tax=Acidilutibacter cellobiosedens TaxID=2507161 RepID=A0A410QFU2_9FIRM|nr:elongation factor G [Acidilutibacter cellobiosedens]QAT62708.1 elongation factor G [Acidilutibacter cellobiosedens]